MWVTLVQIAFVVSAGLVLFGAVVWYVGAVRTAVSGRGDLVIVPFTVAASASEKESTRGAALAKMLQARLQEIEHDLATAQEQLMRPPATVAVSTAEAQAPDASRITSVVPMLFAVQGAALQTRLLEPAQVKITVGGVEVGGVIPWIQRALANRRTLEFTYYEHDGVAVVSGGLEAMGLPGEALRLEIPSAPGKTPDLDAVATRMAAEIVRRRLAGDASNRVEALDGQEFLALVQVLNEASRLNRQVALGRVVGGRFAELSAKLEPLATEVRDWYQLQLLAASIAQSAGNDERARAFLGNARRALDVESTHADRRRKTELKEQTAEIDERIAALRPKVGTTAEPAVDDVRKKIADDLRRANDAFNKLFDHVVQPLRVELLSPDEANAYTDQELVFHAPPAIAQLPEITWHNMSWAHLARIAPVFAGTNTNEENAVIYAYSDILPVAIRQLRLVDAPDPESWDVYAGALAWIEAALQKRDFVPGDDRRPLRSLRDPGGAYDDRVLGKDPQVAHYKNFKPDLEVHAAAGIGGKAFYEAAQRVGLERAVEIWIAGLKQAAQQPPITYRRWAAALLHVAGAERSAIGAALHVVGLDEVDVPADAGHAVSGRRPRARSRTAARGGGPTPGR